LTANLLLLHYEDQYFDVSKEIMAAYSENNMKPINTFHGQIEEHFGVKVICFTPLQCGH
jgi:hypothetical protein